MAEKIYGGNKPSYGVTEREDGWIELRVYHENKRVRKVVQEHINDPSYFLRRRAAYERSDTKAENHLAKVIDDYRSHFAEGRVKIILNPGTPQATAAVPSAGVGLDNESLWRSALANILFLSSGQQHMTAWSLSSMTRGSSCPGRHNGSTTGSSLSHTYTLQGSSQRMPTTSAFPTNPVGDGSVSMPIISVD